MLRIRHKDTKSIIIEFDGDNLEGANLRGKDLKGSVLSGQSLNGADLREADLRDADLTAVTGLTAQSLAGANLDRTKLPAEIAAFDDLKQAEEMSKNCGKYFVGLMLGCAFTLLTMASTSDVGFFNESTSATLPIIGSSVSTLLFYFVAPIVLLAAYVYMHMELQRLWDRLAALPAVFPDGVMLDRKVYPWILNGLANQFTKKEWRRDAPLMGLQRILADTLAWRAVPLVMALLWLRYLRRHDWPGTVVHVALVSISVFVGYMFYRLMVRTMREHGTPLSLRPRQWFKIVRRAVTVVLLPRLRRHNWPRTTVLMAPVLKSVFEGNVLYRLMIRPTHKRGTHIRRRWPRVVRRAFTVVLFPLVLVFYSYGAINAIPEYRVKDGKFLLPPDNAEGLIVHEDQLVLVRSWQSYARLSVPSILALVGYSPFADLSEADVSTRPSGWTGQKQEDFALVKSARLREKDLRYARAYSTFLVKADLTGSDLDGTLLARADLRQANLTGTKLHAVLTDAHLEGANLTEAHLEGADLKRANFAGANLINAHLEGTDLTGANIVGANLTGAHLERANLTGANLEKATGLATAYFDLARLHKARLVGADFTSDAVYEQDLDTSDELTVRHRPIAHLKGADLSQADLRRAKLIRADLSGADLSSANLNSADLSEAALSGVDLRRADLTDTDLSGADLSRATLNGVDFAGKQLSEVKLNSANLTRADLHGADLTGADLSSADLFRAVLSHANLVGANFSQASLNGADLSRAHLSQANFTGADLYGADLSRANLTEVNLKAANLHLSDISRADLSNAHGITQKQIDSVRAAERTKVDRPLVIHMLR